MSNDWDGWASSAQAWIKSMAEQGDWTRRYVLDLPTQAACSPRSGERWLDLGCGEGRFARWLSGQGAKVVGLDPVESMVRHALETGGAGYILGKGEVLPFRDGSFDGVVSYLSMIDIPDFRAAIRECVRILRPEGRLVIANLTSFSTTMPHPRKRDEEGRMQFMAVDGYLDERSEWVEWSDIRVLNWHRPLSAYMKACLDDGLILRAFEEPEPDPDAPGAADYRRAPWGMVMAWQKPADGE